MIPRPCARALGGTSTAKRGFSTWRRRDDVNTSSDAARLPTLPCRPTCTIHFESKIAHCLERDGGECSVDVLAGERLGEIVIGSLAEVHLPPAAGVLVKVGSSVDAGKTAIALLS